MERPSLPALAACCLLAFAASTQAQGPPPRPLVVVAELDGLIHPVSAEYLSEAIADADRADAAALVIVLSTPGGLLDSTRTIVSRMVAARTPVVVYIGPAGARAASAGFFLAMAADVAVMAPGTHLGAAHPVGANGEAMDKTTSDKAASDAAAYIRSLAAARGRNVALAQEAVMESRAFTDEEALAATPPLIDFLADDVDAAIGRLDGRTVKRFDGRETTLRTANATVRHVDMTRRQRLLSAIAHPQIAYMLLTLGLLGLTVELWHPGSVAPGVAGGVCLLLAFFAFQVIPISVSGLLLMVLGVSLLIAELVTPSFGALGIGGAVALFFGSLMLTDTVPGVRVGYGVVAPVSLGLAAITIFLGRLALAAQRRPSMTGLESLVGTAGRVQTPLGPDLTGQILLRGERWRAVSRAPVAPGAAVRVVAVNGLTLLVEPADTSPGERGDTWRFPPA